MRWSAGGFVFGRRIVVVRVHGESDDRYCSPFETHAMLIKETVLVRTSQCDQISLYRIALSTRYKPRGPRYNPYNDPVRTKFADFRFQHSYCLCRFYARHSRIVRDPIKSYAFCNGHYYYYLKPNQKKSTFY